jgi:hypothetical protein
LFLLFGVQDWFKESKAGYKDSDLGSQCSHRFFFFSFGSCGVIASTEFNIVLLVYYKFLTFTYPLTGTRSILKDRRGQSVRNIY